MGDAADDMEHREIMDEVIRKDESGFFRTPTSKPTVTERLRVSIEWMEHVYDRNKGDMGAAAGREFLVRLNDLRAIAEEVERVARELRIAKDAEIKRLREVVHQMHDRGESSECDCEACRSYRAAIAEEGKDG